MFIKKRMKILSIIISLLVILSLVGCISVGTDETQIKQIAKNIEKAIKDKDIGLFMENISYNYSDTDGGTYDNHINNLPENIISQMELAEALASSIWDNFKITADFTVNNLAVVEEQYASGKMKVTFSLEVCLVGSFGCVPVWWVDTGEPKEYDVDFVKEDDNWRIVSLEEV